MLHQYYYGTVGDGTTGYFGRVYHYESGNTIVEDYKSPHSFDEEPPAVDDAVDWAEDHNIEPELE